MDKGPAYLAIRGRRVDLWIVLFNLLALTGCQQGQQDHSKHQQNPDSKTAGQKDDTMAGMDHKGSEILRQDDTGMLAVSGGDHWYALAPNRTVIARQKLVAPVFREAEFKFTGNGYITFDQRRNHKIPVRMGGRIERLFVRYNNQYVRKGEKILELYSPELNTYIEEYIYLKRQTTDSVLQTRAGQKLLLLGLGKGQLKQIDQRGSTSRTIPVYSPFSGYVLFDPSDSPAMGSTESDPGSMSGAMDAVNKQESMAPGTVLTDNSIREGMYVSKGQNLFWINDFKVACALIAVGKDEERYLRKGQGLTLFSELLPGKPLEGTIQMIEQVYQEGQKFSRARVYLPNGSGRLKQNSLVTASFSVPVRSLTIPASSVYDLGQQTIVWLRVGRSQAGSSIFQARVISAGRQSKDQVEVLSGLKEGDQIALDAGYLADSESFIQPHTTDER